MDGIADTYTSVENLLAARTPAEPVYCIYPDAYARHTQFFVGGFPGRVLYAVKANNYPPVLQLLLDSGVQHFDCASLPEIAGIRDLSSEAKCYFMTPVRIRGTAAAAQARYGVRHFLVDHMSGINSLANEIDMTSSVVFTRMAVSHESAMIDLSNRFGAPPVQVPEIMQAVANTGAEPALAFNVGSSVTSPEAYRHSLQIAAGVLRELPFKVRLLDIGGGFPCQFPGFKVPPLQDYFDAIRKDVAKLPLADDFEILGEPGRALAAPGMSAIVEVCLRKENRLFLNDGMYGIFWELRFKGHDRFPVRAYRNGSALAGRTQSFRLFGPTCDSTDELPGNVDLPADIRPGDHLEFGQIGAYSLSGRTSFNGFHSEHIVRISEGVPPE